ncbi:MAG: putative hydro-lyase [Actinoallomurus sp.]|nr:putative hydro-lyase [Actinoallomurus sp.]
MTALERPAILTPSQARRMFRTGEVPATTSGRCPGYVQADLLAVPTSAPPFAITRSPGRMPIIDRSDESLAQ